MASDDSLNRRLNYKHVLVCFGLGIMMLAFCLGFPLYFAFTFAGELGSGFSKLSPGPDFEQQAQRFNENKPLFEAVYRDALRGLLPTDKDGRVSTSKELKQIQIGRIEHNRTEELLYFEWVSGNLDSNHYVIKSTGPDDPTLESLKARSPLYHRLVPLGEGWFQLSRD